MRKMLQAHSYIAGGKLQALIGFKAGGGEGVLIEKLFCSFLNPLISLYIYYEHYENMKKKNQNIFSLRFVSVEMAAIFDFRALTKVHITLKPVLQMQ